MKKVMFGSLLVCATLMLALAGCGGETNAQNDPAHPTLESLMADAGIKDARVEAGYNWKVPDSVKPQMRAYVKELVSAASFHMTGGDYEEPEDVIDEAWGKAEESFRSEKTLFYLVYTSAYNGTEQRVQSEDLPPLQKKVFDYLHR